MTAPRLVVRGLLQVLLLLVLKSGSAQKSAPVAFYSSNIHPVYDEFGFEVDSSYVLERMAMRTTGMGTRGMSIFNLTIITRPVEVPAPLLPQALYKFNDQDSYREVGPAVVASTSYYSSQRQVYKRQAIPGGAIVENIFGGPNFLGNVAPYQGSIALPYGGHAARRLSPAERHDAMCAPDKPLECDFKSSYRTMDGSCNNINYPKWGAINQPFLRLLPAEYFDGYDVPRMTSKSDPRHLLPSPRLVSRTVHEPTLTTGHHLPELTNILQVWGQFVDHDLTATPALRAPDGSNVKCCEEVRLSANHQIDRDVFNGGMCHPIYIPPGDRFFSSSCMNFARSMPAKRARDCNPDAPKEVRQQMNMITAWMDSSQVYGSTMKNSEELRVYHRGLMRVTEDELLPEDKDSECLKENPGDYCFLAGEGRVNEHPALTVLHTVFHRFHNRLALALSKINPRWSDETTFQETRRIVGGVMQHMTFHDWLPLILGPSVMRQYSLNVISAGSYGPSYWHYDSKLNPTIANEFATAAFRFGHTLIPSFFSMGDVQVRLFTLFNRPKYVLNRRETSIHNMCNGLMSDPMFHADRFMASDLVDHLFQDKNVSLDLASLNIQRSRDHGLPGYNAYRGFCKLPVYKSFEDMYQQEPERAEIFSRVYADVDDIDLFAGGLSEKVLPGGVVGPTFACIIARQFHVAKFGDRFWYESTDGPGAFTADQLAEIRKMTLSKVMCYGSSVKSASVNVFLAAGVFLPRGVQLPNGVYVTQNRYVPCEDLPDIDLRKWYDSAAQ